MAISSSTTFLAAAPPADAQLIDLLLALGRALHEAGQPAHQLDEVLGRVAARLGGIVQVMSIPTGLMVSYRQKDGPVAAMLLVAPGAVNLERLADLELLAEDLAAGRATPREARERLDRLKAAPPRWGRSATVGAYLTSAMAFAVFFHGGWAEVLVAGVVGLAVGLLAVLMRRVGPAGRLFELTAAAAAAFIAGAADVLVGAFVGAIPLAAGLIILLPGLALVTAAEERAHGRLASGGARMAGVTVAFLALGFGVLVGGSVAARVSDELTAEEPERPLFGWALVPAVVLVAVGSTVRFRARPVDFWVILAASAVALFGSRLGREWVGPVGGSFLGAMLLGVVANVYAHQFRRPAELVETPGLALLVPGSVGLRSLAALIDHDTQAGVDEAFHMLLIATALVAGLLFGSAIFRRDCLEPGG